MEKEKINEYMACEDPINKPLLEDLIQNYYKNVEERSSPPVFYFRSPFEAYKAAWCIYTGASLERSLHPKSGRQLKTYSEMLDYISITNFSESAVYAGNTKILLNEKIVSQIHPYASSQFLIPEYITILEKKYFVETHDKYIRFELELAKGCGFSFCFDGCVIISDRPVSIMGSSDKIGEKYVTHSDLIKGESKIARIRYRDGVEVRNNIATTKIPWYLNRYM